MELENLDNPLDYIPRYLKVLTKADKRGYSDLVPMKLWKAQEHYIRNRTHRDFILKNRQQGASHGVMAPNAHRLFTVPRQRQAVVAHNFPTSEYLFQTFVRFYDNLPPDKKPQAGLKSEKRMQFPNLDSYIYVDSAETEALSIARTLNSAHLSEFARWKPNRAAQLYADISQTVPEGGFITIETTPFGRGTLAYKLYQAAKLGEINYKAFFYPWWWDASCAREITRPIIPTPEEKDFIDYVKGTDKIDISLKQLAFRREKINELGDLFFQEYPENDTDCWLSSDISVFNGVDIRKYLQKIEPGYQAGYRTIWKDVIGGERYVMGVDVAGGMERGDWSVASVIRVRTNEYVARIRAKMPPDMFAQECLSLGRHYNYDNCMIGVERASHGHTVLRILLEANYPNIYQHQDYDNFMGNLSFLPGFPTSAKTKPLLLDSFGSAIRAGDLISWSENLMLEASNYVWNGTKAEAGPGAYDDELMAMMIALQLRQTLPIVDLPRQSVTSYHKL